MANPTTGRELHEAYLKDVKAAQWRPTDPQPARTRETLKRDMREFLVAQTGSETLADLSLTHLTTQADARVRLEAELRADLGRIDVSIEAFRRETSKVLAPLEQRVAQAEAQAAAAAAALKDARESRDSELARGLSAKKIQIEGALRGVEVLQGRIVPWREGGSAPEFPPGTR